MGFLNNIRIPVKVGGGFGIILVLLVMLAVVAMWGLTSIGGYFTEYRGLARTTAEVVSMNVSFMDARLQGKKYLEDNSADARDRVREAGQRALNQAEQASEVAYDPDHKRILREMRTQFEDYLAVFDQVVTKQNKRNELVEVLDTVGPQMEQNLTEIMRSANEDADVDAVFEASVALRNLMLVRLYAGKFLLNNNREAVDRVKKEWADFEQAMTTLRADLFDPERRRLAEEIVTAGETYATTFDAVLQAIRERNDLVARMDTIGPEIADAIHDIEHTAMKRQDTVGPAAQAAIRNTVMTNVILAVIAVLLGLVAAIVISRSLTGPISRLTSAMGRLADKDTSVDIPATNHGDEVGDMSRAVLVFKESMIKSDQLVAEQVEAKRAEEARANHIKTLNEEFDRGVGGVLDTVASAGNELQATAQTMASIADETNSQATAVAAASEEASSNVQTVSSAAEELSASIQEIARQVQQASTVSARTADQAGETRKVVEGLDAAAQKIGEVVTLINDIAAQTNLLALNATIEAARAGDAGKGFAVVANEVKNLANQTSKATEDISNQIGGIQTETRNAVQAIEKISQSVNEVSEVSSSIASAVEEQNAATQEIARNVEQAAAGTTEVSSNIATVTQAAAEAGQASNQVLTASSQLAEESESLRGMVKQYLEDVRSA